jgi:hypothetical protein
MYEAASRLRLEMARAGRRVYRKRGMAGWHTLMNIENHNGEERVMRAWAGAARDHGRHGSAVLGAPVPTCPTHRCAEYGVPLAPGETRMSSAQSRTAKSRDAKSEPRPSNGPSDTPKPPTTRPCSKPFKNRSSAPQTPLFCPPFLSKSDQIMTNKDTAKTINP